VISSNIRVIFTKRYISKNCSFVREVSRVHESGSLCFFKFVFAVIFVFATNYTNSTNKNK
jgi:hypothetical protein